MIQLSENEREWEFSQLLFADNTALVVKCEECLQKLVTVWQCVKEES